MSTTRSYTTRLRQRTAAPKPVRQLPGWLTTRQVPALLALCAELIHLAAALIEWPAATPRGGFHILIAAALGALTTTVYFGQPRWAPAIGIGLAMTTPVAWLAGAPLGLSPYHNVPTLAAVALTVLEIALAGFLGSLVTSSRFPGPSRRTQACRPARTC